jgi:iron complex outermembrane receptor protein
VGNFTNNGYTAPAIAFNVDDVYIGRPSSTIASFLDLDRVEVLKGPQGTLYGRNATGGAINVHVKKPLIGETSGEITVGAGNYSAQDVTAIANIAVGDVSALRFAGTISDRDGYMSDGTGDADDTAFRLQFLTEPTDELSIRVAADYSTQQGVGPGGDVDGVFQQSPGSPDLDVANWSFVEANFDDFTGLHSAQVLNFIEENAAASPLFSPLTGYAYPQRDDVYWGLNAEVTYSFDNAELVIIPSYRYSVLDNQFNGPPFKAAVNQDEAEQYSIEARFSASAGILDYIVGAYYFDETVEGVNSFNQFATITFNDYESNVDSTALFARGTFNISDEFRLVAAARFTDEGRSFDTRAQSVAAVCLIGGCPQVPTLPVGATLADTLGGLDPDLFTAFPASVYLDNVAAGEDGIGVVMPYGPFGPNGPQAIIVTTPNSVDATDGDEKVTYRLAAEYDITLDSLVYLSYETGFRAGGFNQAFGQETYDLEEIDAITFGSKNRFMDNRLEVNAELFFWQYEDQQLAALGLDARGNRSFYTRNVGDSTIKGLELDFKFAAAKNTLIKGSLQYLDATYDDYLYEQVNTASEELADSVSPVTGCDVSRFTDERGRFFNVDCSGQEALNSPEITFTFGIQQTFELGDYELVGNLDGRYRDEREIGFNYLPNGRVDSDFTADAALSLSPFDGTWNVTAYVRNLTDETIASTYQVGAGNVASSVNEPPRTYGVRASYNF